MCIVFFCFLHHPKYKLVIASNRDEFFDRPTAKAHYWNDIPHILAGRDLQRGGTWLGISENGRFTFLTNWRTPVEEIGPRSRGELCTRYMDGKESLEEFQQFLHQHGAECGGFNLVFGDLLKGHIFYYSNHTDGKVRALSPGDYGLTNAELDCNWWKLKRGKSAFSQLLHSEAGKDADDITKLTHALFRLMSDTERAPEDQLPDTGVGFEKEKGLSSICVRLDPPDDGYSTRSSTVILVDHDNNVHLCERSFQWQSSAVEDVWHQMKLKQAPHKTS